MATRTITLTGRPPVKIDDADWNIIANASDSGHDGQVESQANRKSSWWIKVRQHVDGRTIVYAGYSHSSNWQGERCYEAKRGVMLPKETTAEAICDAIREVRDDIASAEHYEGDESRWPTLAAECIASMPAEELS
jgi:hypothetical protein